METSGGMGERVSINWFNVFDAEPGKVVVALYSAKKKAAYISKVDVTSL
ncbi:MAG: hypothetical protein IT258_04170 [Saprospiraceae bacterium]|nr:hypothetical protein [Saprospiraceae bacterium]